MAAGLSVDVEGWRHEFDELMLRVGTRFARVEPRRRMVAFVRGLLAGLPRVNCWSIAEHAGDAGPRGMQRLLSAAVWDGAGVSGDLRGYGLGYVLAVAKSHPVTTGTGARPAIEWARRLPARAWQRLSAGPGAKGPRWYDWAFIEVTDPAVTGGGLHWLLIRRRISDGEYAF